MLQGLFTCVAGLFGAKTLAPTPAGIPAPLPELPAGIKLAPVEPMWPIDAGFTGRYVMSTRGPHRSPMVCHLARAASNSAGRYKLAPNQMGYWRNTDGSVAQLMYRNEEGKLFALKFCPVEEPVPYEELMAEEAKKEQTT